MALLRTCMLILCISCSPVASWTNADDGSEDVLNHLMSALDVDAFVAAAKEVLGDSSFKLDDDLKDEFENGESLVGANCAACRTALSTSKTLIRNGATFEDVRDQAISICVPVCNGMGYIGEIMCPGVIDNFGPEVVYMLNVTDADYSANDICSLYRQCGEGIRNADGETEKKLSWTAPRKIKAKQERNYDELLKVVHVTDVHVDLNYHEGAAAYCDLPLCCRDGYNGTGPAEFWGDYQCGVPTHTVESFLRQLAELDPDVIIYTGDSPPHAIWLETQWGQIDDSRYVTEMLAKYFPDIPSYTALGNHDTYPVNMYGRDRPEYLTEELNEALTSYWAPVSRFGPDQIESFLYGGYFSIEVQPGLRIISYNSNYGTTENFFWLIPYDIGEVQEMFDFVESEFVRARENNEKVMLLGHHPNGGNGRFTVYETFMYEITRDYGDIILFHLNGHSHADNFAMTYDVTNGEARNVWMSAPTMGTKTNKNPSARILYLDPVTFAPLDFDNVIFNLSAVMLDNPDVEPQLEYMYRASEEYGLADLSPDSWADFVDRMETDADLFWRYKYNEATRTSKPGACDDACRRRELCNLKNVVAEHRAACRNAP